MVSVFYCRTGDFPENFALQIFFDMDFDSAVITFPTILFPQQDNATIDFGRFSNTIIAICDGS